VERIDVGARGLGARRGAGFAGRGHGANMGEVRGRGKAASQPRRQSGIHCGCGLRLDQKKKPKMSSGSDGPVVAIISTGLAALIAGGTVPRWWNQVPWGWNNGFETRPNTVQRSAPVLRIPAQLKRRGRAL